MIMPYKNTNVQVRSPDGDRLLRHCSRCAARNHIRPISVYHLQRFQASKGMKQKLPCTNNNADAIAFLENIPVQAETLLHSPERAAAGIGLYVNVDKTEYMCFNQRGDISSLNGSSLKLVDNMSYLGSSVSSTKKDANTRQGKAWTPMDRLSVICKSDKIKRSFFKAVIVSILLCGCTTWTLAKRTEKKLEGNYTIMLWAVLNKSGGNTLQNSSCTANYYPSGKLSSLDEPDKRGTAREVRTNS